MTSVHFQRKPFSIMVIQAYAPTSNAEEAEIEWFYENLWASLVAKMVKHLSAMLETSVRSLGWEDPLEKGKATHSSILAWRNPWTIQSMGIVHGVKKSQARLFLNL